MTGIAPPEFPPFTGFEWDEAKRIATLETRGIDFKSILNFKFETAFIWSDRRRDYGEPREVAIGLIGGRLHVLCFTRKPPNIRVISLRKANAREIKHYAESL